MDDFDMGYNEYDNMSWEEARPFGDALTFEENQLAQEGHDDFFDEANEFDEANGDD